jgi:hypothetical protein
MQEELQVLLVNKFIFSFNLKFFLQLIHEI